MSKAVREFFEQIKTAENPGILATAREIGGQLWDNAKPMFDHGRTEAVAALFAGHAHVMYMHNEKGVEQDQTIEATPQMEVEGREM
jgi:hypothetical protein